MAAGELGVWDLRLATETVQYAPAWKQRLGFPDPALPDSTHFWRCRVHPDDLAPMQAALHAHVAGADACYECRFRLRSNGSGYRSMHSRGRIVERAAGGRALRMVGTMIDLTDRAPTPQAGLPAGPRGAMAAAALVEPFHGCFIDEAAAGMPPDERHRLLGKVQDLLHATLAQWDARRAAPPASVHT